MTAPLVSVPLGREVSRLLLPGERVRLVVRRHPVVIVVPVAAALASSILVVLLDVSTRPAVDVVVRLLWGLVLVPVLWASLAVADWRRGRVVLTDRRIVHATGSFHHRVSMVPLVDIEDLRVQRQPWARALGCGDLAFRIRARSPQLGRIRCVPQWQAIHRIVAAAVLSAGPATRAAAWDDADTGELPVIGP